jgi:hypothetical protein
LEKSNQIQRYYHGFDISPDQFPKDSGRVQFSVHDITKPFPKEHLNRYDLVHVRLLVAAIDETDYPAAIANVYSILSKSTISLYRISILTPLQSQEAILNGKKSTKKRTYQITTPSFGRSEDASIHHSKPRVNVSKHQPRSVTNASQPGSWM